MWKDGKRHPLTWTYKTVPRAAIMAATGTISKLPFLGVGGRRLMLRGADFHARAFGWGFVTFDFVECDWSEHVDLGVIADGKEKWFAMYGETDFRAMLREPRRSWWRRLVTWIKGRISKFGEKT